MPKSRLFLFLLLATLGTACNDHGLKVHEDPPTATLLDPADLDTFIVGMNVSFEAQLDDKDDGVGSLDLQWKSNAQGTLHGESTLDGKVMQFVTDELEIGTHIVTVKATDPDGNTSEDTVEIIIVANRSPTIAFSPEPDSPPDGAAFVEHEPIQVQVQVSDSEDPVEALRLDWTVNGTSIPSAPTNPALGGVANHEITDLTEGEHTISVTVTDTLGESSQASISVLVLTDLDGDGFGAEEHGGTDCDDNDADISPEADEVCDDIDNDCDELIDGDDDDLTDGFTGHPDADEDGYGDAALTVDTCNEDDLADNGDDCNDDDALIHPAADEVCDDIDNDCDELIDLDDEDLTDAVIGYADVDGDGYGDDSSSIATCDASDLSDTPGDCNDLDPSTHPGAYEICGDGIDNDCDGTPGDCNWSGEVPLSTADHISWGETSEDEIATSLAGGDLDGDGLTDLIVGARLAGPEDMNCGAVYLLSGGLSMTMGSMDVHASWTMDGVSYLDKAGTDISVFDIDDDGADDLFVGAPQADSAASGSNHGIVYLFHGPVTDGGSLDEADAWIEGEGGDHKLGTTIIGNGDIDGDGLPDMVAGAPNENSLASEGGAAYLFLGDTSPWSGAVSAADMDAKFVSNGANNHLSTSMSFAGDVNGDGRDDLLLGAPGGQAHGNKTGHVVLFLGHATNFSSGATRVQNTADARYNGISSHNELGTSVSGLGDVDGDGYDEFAMGAIGTEMLVDGGGTLYMMINPDITGTHEVDDAADIELWGTYEDGHLSKQISAQNDLNNDGIDDLVIAAPEASSNSGRTYLLYGPIDEIESGPLSGDDGIEDAVFVGEHSRDFAGRAILGGYDWNDDGVSDFAISATGLSGSPSLGDSGGVAVFFGSGL